MNTATQDEAQAIAEMFCAEGILHMNESITYVCTIPNIACKCGVACKDSFSRQFVYKHSHLRVCARPFYNPSTLSLSLSHTHTHPYTHTHTHTHTHKHAHTHTHTHTHSDGTTAHLHTHAHTHTHTVTGQRLSLIHTRISFKHTLAPTRVHTRICFKCTLTTTRV